MTVFIAQRRHREDTGEVHVRVENQAHNGDTDDGQQNPAWNLHFFQTDNHRQTNQRHDHREAVELTQRHRQTVDWVLNDHAHAVCRDQQQEQANTDAGTVRNALRQIAQNPATNPGSGDDGEQHAHQEYGTQGNRNTDLLAQNQAKRGEGGQ